MSAGNGAGQGLAGANVELGTAQGAGNDLAVQRAQFQRRIHVSAAALDGIVTSTAIADDDLASVQFDGFHPAGGDLIGANCADKLVTQGPHPLAAVGAGYSDP